MEIGREHREPKSLVRAAIDHKERAPRSAADRYTAYDEVWCVMDVEAPVAHPSLPSAIRLAREHGISVALSNPCFELWLLLHFKTVSNYHSSEEMQRVLAALETCGYAVERKDFDFDALRGRFEQARQRAVELRRTGPSVSSMNPSTNVDLLVDLLVAARHGRSI